LFISSPRKSVTDEHQKHVEIERQNYVRTLCSPVPPVVNALKHPAQMPMG
jgi:hypothetical protein